MRILSQRSPTAIRCHWCGFAIRWDYKKHRFVRSYGKHSTVECPKATDNVHEPAHVMSR